MDVIKRCIVAALQEQTKTMYRGGQKTGTTLFYGL